MPKKRNKENLGLPARWRFYHGAYYYHVPPGYEPQWGGKKQYRLGKSLPEAYRAWSKLLGEIEKTQTIAQLLDRYALEVIPDKAAKTRTNNTYALKRLRIAFGHIPIAQIEPRHLYQYRDLRSKKEEHEKGRATGGVVAANREIRLMSHVFTKAVEWGCINRHPFKGQIIMGGEKPRTRYIEDWEIVECLALPPKSDDGGVKAIQGYIRLKLLMGLRRGDLLRLTEAQLKEDGIHVTTSKTGKPIVYEWSDELRAAIEIAKDARPVHICPWLFCNRYGQGYLNETTGDAHGWNSMWQRFMKRMLKETELKQRFTDHDLRAKVSSDADGLEHARALLAHADSRITQRVYRRKPERVKPAK